MRNNLNSCGHYNIRLGVSWLLINHETLWTPSSPVPIERIVAHCPQSFVERHHGGGVIGAAETRDPIIAAGAGAGRSEPDGVWY